jgi:hypothetical protein
MGYVVREVNWTHVANAMEQPCQLSQLFYAVFYLASVSEKFLCLRKVYSFRAGRFQSSILCGKKLAVSQYSK